MDDGTRVLFTEEALRAAADTQAGEPLTVDHPRDDDGRPQYPPPVDETVGKVAKAGFIEGRGVGYEATTHDDDLAAGMEAGSFEVSVHPEFTLGEQDPETGAYLAENIQFRDLSVVSKGDSPSNTANWGPSQELAAWASSTNIGDQLVASPGAGSDDLSRRGLLNGLRDLFASDESAGDEPAESGTDTDTDPDTTMNDRDDKTAALVDALGFEAETLDSMTDEQIATMHDRIVDEDSTDADPSDGEDDDSNVVEVDIGDHDSVEAYLDERAEQAVASAQAEATREELIAEITTQSDDYDADDLADWPTDALEDKRASLTSGARLPGSTGRHTETVTASHSGETDDNLDAYGTGVEN